MAEKKTVTKKVETKEAETKEPTVRIRLEKTRDNKAPLYVSVNGESFMIERGVEVEVPLYIYEQIRHHNKMMEERMAFEESLEASFAK